MSNEEKVEKWIEENKDQYCSYCIWSDNCPKDVVCYGGASIEPPCFNHDDPKDYLDLDAVLEDLDIIE